MRMKKDKCRLIKFHKTEKLRSSRESTVQGTPYPTKFEIKFLTIEGIGHDAHTQTENVFSLKHG